MGEEDRDTEDARVSRGGEEIQISHLLSCHWDTSLKLNPPLATHKTRYPLPPRTL